MRLGLRYDDGEGRPWSASKAPEKESRPISLFWEIIGENRIIELRFGREGRKIAGKRKIRPSVRLRNGPRWQSLAGGGTNVLNALLHAWKYAFAFFLFWKILLSIRRRPFIRLGR